VRGEEGGKARIIRGKMTGNEMIFLLYLDQYGEDAVPSTGSHKSVTAYRDSLLLIAMGNLAI
jgi:hypothetical protein